MARTNTKKPTAQQRPKTRQLRPVKPKLFGLVLKKKYRVKMPSAWKVLKQANRHLWKHKKLFLALLALYLVITIIFVRAFKFTGDLNTIKQALDEMFSASGGSVVSSLAVFGYILSGNSPNGEGAAVYQSNILILSSLAIIWALRQTYAKQQVSLKAVLYKSAYPIIPFILVLLMIGLQCLPFIFGGFLFQAAVLNGAAVELWEKSLWSGLYFASAVWTIYMISASVFALYIVTLPDMTPVGALRSAKKLVKYRRWSIIRKLLFFPVVVGLILGLTTLLAILFVTPLAEIIFMVASAFTFFLFHTYVYTLYRELL